MTETTHEDLEPWWRIWLNTAAKVALLLWGLHVGMYGWLTVAVAIAFSMTGIVIGYRWHQYRCELVRRIESEDE